MSVSSNSLSTWQTVSAAALDQIEAAHAAVGGVGRGRRYTTQQVNHAYAVILSSQFQRFCRDLHSEAADHLASQIASPLLRNIVRTQLTGGRKLDTGNPNPGNLGSDFGRFDIEFWSEVIKRQKSRNKARQEQLELLNAWRNAIAHQDFKPAKLGGATRLGLATVQGWRRACSFLAVEFDMVLGAHLATITGRATW